MISGYYETERTIINREGWNRYANLRKLVQRGERPLYRRAWFEKSKRAQEKLWKKKHWFGADKFGVVFDFVQATPGQILKKAVEKAVGEKKFNIKVVEKGGRSVKQFLQKSDVRDSKKCGLESCPVCESGGSGCARESVGYTITCLQCEGKHVYHGETGRSGRMRMTEHRDKLLKSKGALVAMSLSA